MDIFTAPLLHQLHFNLTFYLLQLDRLLQHLTTTPRTPVVFVLSLSALMTQPLVLCGQFPSESVRRQNASEVFSLPESIKSKLSAASAKYKESIAKSTRGLKEKLLARNTSVKELSKSFQSEMNAGIASVERMIERFNLTSKQSSTSPLISSFPLKGKTVQESGAMVREDSGAVVRDVNSNSPSRFSSMVTDQL